MGLEDAETADELLGVTDAPVTPCAECAQYRRMGLIVGAVCGIALGISLAVIVLGRADHG